jgi:hypothetical protein
MEKQKKLPQEKMDSVPHTVKTKLKSLPDE